MNKKTTPVLDKGDRDSDGSTVTKGLNKVIKKKLAQPSENALTIEELEEVWPKNE